MNVQGLLVSQIGYDRNGAKRAILRGPSGLIGEGARYEVRPISGSRPTNYLPVAAPTPMAPAAPVARGEVAHWGAKWGSDWWIADFSDLAQAGRYELIVRDGEREFWSDEFAVGDDILWNETWFLAGIDQAERRSHLARHKVGWQDCGSPLQECNSHSAFIIGLLDVLEFKRERMTDDEARRLEAQINNGCALLNLYQDEAAKRGLGEGALIHELPGFADVTLIPDAAQAAVCWARASQLLRFSPAEQLADYRQRAGRALGWFEGATPSGAQGFSHVAHGVGEDWVPPLEHLTTDLVMALWANFVLAPSPDDAFGARCVRLANQIMARQIARADDEFYGHFQTFDSVELSEKSWLHCLSKTGIGSDVGATFPHWILPLLWMHKRWPDHPDAEQWERTVRDFAYGYFLPACRQNPFLILPLGLFPGEGLLWFSGLWHGINCVYGLAAALALEFERHFGDADFGAVATGNLQWIAGLNAGLTRASLFGSAFWSADVPDGAALPVSMIYGIGHRFAGNWLAVRGSICNGFSTGEQFVFDQQPSRELDGPHSFTDEDWIPHAGGWLSGLARL